MILKISVFTYLCNLNAICFLKREIFSNLNLLQSLVSHFQSNLLKGQFKQGGPWSLSHTFFHEFELNIIF